MFVFPRAYTNYKNIDIQVILIECKHIKDTN